MENQLDKLFKEKLENHSLTPSEGAWKNVESKLSKKNNILTWRIAASILITGALVSVLIWSQRNVGKPQLAVDTHQSNKDSKKEKRSISQTEKKSKIKSIVSSIGIQSPRSEKLPKNKPEQKEIQQREEEPLKSQEGLTNEKTIAIRSEATSLEKKQSDATLITPIASTRQKPIKLEFTLDDFAPDEKVVATNEAKNTGLKRVWELAKEVKNGEGPIREMKNELFAFNFKKNKNQ